MRPRRRESMVSHDGDGRERRRLRRTRPLRTHAHWGDVSDCAPSGSDFHDERTSSSDDCTGGLKRKRGLDNALFDFFTKQAIKSLKRDFSKFCSESDIWDLKSEKKQTVGAIGKDAYSVYSAKYFFEVLHRLTVDQRSIIQNFGFGCLLYLCKTHLPSSFIRWLALRVDPVCSELSVGNKTISISKDAFHFVLGLPNSGSCLVEDSVGGLEFIMSLFNLSEPPHITFFGDKLKSKDPMTNKEVFACFMQVAVSCFLCPSFSDSIDTKYIGQLGDPERASRFDLCMLVHQHLLIGVTKTLKYIQCKGRKPRFFEFCAYGLAVYYLDSLDFGVHVAGSGVPRSVSWRGDMINFYSELDREGRKGFGRRRMREDLARCYSHNAPSSSKCCAHCGSHDDHLIARHKDSMHEKFDTVLPRKLMDDIFDTVHSFYSTSAVSCNNPATLVQNVFQVLADARVCFESSSHIQKDLFQASFANLAVSANKAEVVETPTNQIVANKQMTTAPVLPHVRKVMPRLNVHVPEGRQEDFGQRDLISPIGRIHISAFSDEKAPTTIPVNSPVVKPFVGSIETPVQVGDTTPKAVLVSNSPEVTITGISSFKHRQNEFGKDTDVVYNRLLIKNKVPNMQTSRESVQNAPVQRTSIEVADDNLDVPAGLHIKAKDPNSSNRLIILKPKQSLILPLPHNPRFPVSDEDIMHYCAIIDIAYTEKTQRDYAIKYHGVHCSYISLGQTLMPNGHIDNFLIPCFCRKLFEDKHPSKSGRHYFFSYIGESILKHSPTTDVLALVRTSFLGAASASKFKKLDSSDSLFFPICHEDHWFTFVVDFKWKLFVFLDSYYSPDSEYQRSVQGQLRKNFALLWNEIFQTDEPDFRKYKVFNGRIPRQDNPHDCGVMTMMAMEYFKPEKDLCKLFSKDDIPHIRIQYANRLFFHTGNRVDVSLVTNLYDKDDFMQKLQS